MEATRWYQVDERVLQWVATLPPSFAMESHTLQLSNPEPFAPLDGLTSRDVHEGLVRLISHGLVAGDEAPAMGNSSWAKLRVTAAGWIVLGVWLAGLAARALRPR